MSDKSIIERKILNVDSKICSLFDEIETHDRKWVSDMVVQFLRTFVEHVIARVYAEDFPSKRVVIGQTNIKNYNSYIIQSGKYPYLKELLESLNKSVSHFVPEGDGAERLMLMYYANLLQIKRMMKEKFDLNLLKNIRSFPVDIDKTLDNYYVAISKCLIDFNKEQVSDFPNQRYYVIGSKPIVVGESVLYEITLSLARGNISKVDRFIAFSKDNVPDNYAIQVVLQSRKVKVNGFKMPVYFMEAYRVAIRPCELEKIALLCGENTIIKSGNKVYIEIMNHINITGRTLLDELLSENENFECWSKKTKLGANEGLERALKKLREVLVDNGHGANLVRYFLFFLRNDILKDQISNRSNNWLSDLYLKNESKPFDDMPFATSLNKHNANLLHLLKCIDTDGREHEFLARHVNEAAYENNIMYVEMEEENQDYYAELKDVFNEKLPDTVKQKKRRIGTFGKNLCIDYYIEETKEIIQKLKDFSGEGINCYSEKMKGWLKARDDIDDDAKRAILGNLFTGSKVGIVYGTAGTGKTRVIEYITEFFWNQDILFLANTNTAMDNLRRRTGFRFTYSTIYSYLESGNWNEFDLIVMDECSMVSNRDMHRILEKDNYNSMLLVGDVYQIESIEFGNWFNFARYFLDKISVYELTTPYRAKDNNDLINIWNSVRTYDKNMFLKMQNMGVIDDLSDEIFIKKAKDEIVLCLGYNGIYGINNINRIMQGNNSSEAIEWGVWTYKVGDPIIFTETRRFENVLYNNLKGTITGIEKEEERIKFTIELERHYEEVEFAMYEIELIEQKENGNSVISFYVDKLKERDEDVDNQKEIVPFQIAYAVSIHKAQGLEYDSVKVVITKDIEERISHSIFYTAITRAKENLKVYMSGEIQKNLVERFIKDNNGLMQVQKFAGQTGLRVKNRLSS